MTSLYNCKHSGDQYRITKFTSDFEVEASYLCDLNLCECPAGHRPKCRHREMLPKFIQRNAVGTGWMFDYDRGGWVQMEDATVNYDRTGWIASEALPIQQEVEPSLTIAYEITLPADATPDQVAEAFGNLLAPIDKAIENTTYLKEIAPAGLGQASEQTPSPSPTIRRRV